jgi:TolA-binding protein
LKGYIVIALCAAAALGLQYRAWGADPGRGTVTKEGGQAEEIIETILSDGSEEKPADADKKPAPDGTGGKTDGNASSDMKKTPDAAPAGNKKTADTKQDAAPKVTTEEEVLLRTGIDFYKNGMYDASLRKFQELGGKFPKGALKESAGFWAGRVMARLYRYDDAIREFSAVTPESGDYQASLFFIGECYQMKGDRVASIEYYQKVYSLFPSRDLADKALLNIGKLYLDQQKGPQALDSAVRLVKEYKDRDTVDDAYYLMGKIYEKDPRLKDVETARRIYRQFIKKAETDPQFANSPLKKKVADDLARIEKMYFKMEK